MTGCINYRWFVVLASFSVRAIAYGVTYTSGIVYVIILDNFQTGKAETSWISSIITTVMFASGPLIGMFLQRFGWRGTAFASGLIAGTGLVFSSLSPSLPILILSYGFVTGFGCGIAYMIACVTVPAYFLDYPRQKSAVAMAACGTGLGTLVFSPIVQTLDANYGWRGMFIVLAGVAVQFCSIGLLFRPVSNVNVYACRKPIATWNFLKNPGFYVTHAGFLLTAFGDSVIYGHLGQYAKTIGYSTAEGAYLYSVVGLSVMLLKLLQGITLDVRSSLSFPIKLAMVFYLLGGIATSALLLTETYPMLIVYSSIFGANNAASGGAIVIGILEAYYGEENLELTIGANLAFIGIGNLLGSPIAGIIYESNESYTSVLLMVSLVKVLSSLLFLWALKCFPEIQRTIHVKACTSEKMIKTSKEQYPDVSKDTVENEKSALLLTETERSSYSKRMLDNSKKKKKIEISDNKATNQSIITGSDVTDTGL